MESSSGWARCRVTPSISTVMGYPSLWGMGGGQGGTRSGAESMETGWIARGGMGREEPGALRGPVPDCVSAIRDRGCHTATPADPRRFQQQALRIEDVLVENDQVRARSSTYSGAAYWAE